MLKKLASFSGYSLKGRLLVWVLAIYVLCLSVVLSLIPILDGKLESFNKASTNYIERAKEVEGTNYARLLVMELARQKDLLAVQEGPESPTDQPIIDLLWEKITFNSAIDGIELIQAQKNAKGEHVTFVFYRQPPGEKPKPGAKKEMKGFAGLEEELLDGIIQRQQVDQKLLGTINHGRKKEGEMMLRYFPVHVLLPGWGALYWGVAKIGINTSWVRRTLADERRSQEQLRRILMLQILLILFISAILFIMLTYLFPWVRRLMKPLNTLVAVAEDLNEVRRPQDYALWLENLKRFDHRGQAEVAGIQRILLRLANSLPRLGQRLATEESQACLGKLMGRSLPALQNLTARLQTLSLGADQNQAPGPGTQETREVLDKLHVGLQDLLRFWPAGTVTWQRLDLTPGLESAWRLVRSRAPAGVDLNLDLQPMPPVWGSPVDLPLAVLYLLDVIVDHLEPGGRLSLKAAPSPAGGVQIALEVLGSRLTAAEWQNWLSPWQGYEEVREQLGPALAAAIVAQHGGTLTVQAKDKGGVILSFTLPPLVKADESSEAKT
jgi:signal transduction histidine kinase